MNIRGVNMDRIIELLNYIFLGMVQGITEILPISSSGHLVLFQHILGVNLPGLGFEMFTNMASLLAMILFFRKDILTLIKDNLAFIFKKDKTKKSAFEYALKLLIAVIPIGIIGLLFKNELAQFKTLLSVGIALMITGLFLLYIYRFRNETSNDDEISFKDALSIGLFQAIAVFPGVSRSGSTIIGGLFRRVPLKKLLKFSFLCYIIVSIPTSFLAIIEISDTAVEIDLIGYFLAFISTFIFTYFAAKLILKKLQIKHLIYFASYVITVGLIAVVSYFLI